MIAKKILPKSTDGEPPKDNFTQLAEYIAAAREDGEKLDQFWIANCDAGTDLEDLDTATAEVEAVRMQKPEVADKSYHLVISFHPGEQDKLDKAALQDIVTHYAEALGFSEHQYVAGSHVNTDNFHIHVAFNRVHPKTFKVHAPFNDFPALEKVSRAMEKKYGLIVDRGMSDPKPEATLSPGARDFEAHTWQESFQRHVLTHRDEILAELKTADDWAAVHRALARFDIRLKPHGAGLVLTDPRGGQAMKASALHRSCAKGALEKRLGAFEPARFAEEPTPPPPEPALDNDAPAEEAPSAEEALTPQDGGTAGGTEPSQPPEASASVEPERPQQEAVPEPAPVVATTAEAPDLAPQPSADAAASAPSDTSDAPAAEDPELPPLVVPPIPDYPYRTRPLDRRPGLGPLWRRYLLQRGRPDISPSGKPARNARNWKAFLLLAAHDDPLALVTALAHQELLKLILGPEPEPAPPPRISPEISAALSRWRHALPWAEQPAPWVEDRRLVSAGTRIDEAGNLVVPFRDIGGRLQSLRLYGEGGRTLDVGRVSGGLHLIDPSRTLTTGGTVIVTTDYMAAVAIRRATKSPVVVAASEEDVPHVVVALAKKHGRITPILAVTPANGAIPLINADRVDLPEPPKAEDQEAQAKASADLRLRFARLLDDQAILAWDEAKQWAKPDNTPWLATQDVPGFGVRVTDDSTLAVPLRTLAGRIEDVLHISAKGDTFRVIGEHPDAPLVHRIDPKRKMGTAPVFIATTYTEAAALHRATAAPVVLAADPEAWPEIAAHYRERYPHVPIILPQPPDKAALAAEAAAELGVIVVGRDITPHTGSEAAEELRDSFADLLNDKAFLCWHAARPAEKGDHATHPWLAYGRATAAARLDAETGDVLLPLRDGDLRIVGVLAVGPEGRERWRIGPPPPCLPEGVAPKAAPEVLYHPMGGWLGKDGEEPLVVTADLDLAVALHRDSPATVVHVAGDFAATVTALHQRMPHRPITVVARDGAAPKIPDLAKARKAPKGKTLPLPVVNMVTLPPDDPPAAEVNKARRRLTQRLAAVGVAARDYEQAKMAWEETVDWATPETSPWLKEQGEVSGYGMRRTGDGSLALPLRTVSGRMNDVMMIGQDGRVSLKVKSSNGPLVHRIDPQRRIGADPVVIASDYVQAAAIHRATRAPVLMAANPEEWPEIAKALREQHPECRVVLPLPPEQAALAAETAAELGVTVVAQDCAELTELKQADQLRDVLAEAVNDQVILRLRGARAIETADREALPWLAAGRGAARLRIDEAGDVLLPLHDGANRLAGVLAVDAEGRERWRLDDLRPNAPQALYHVVGGWLGRRTDTSPLVVATDLSAAVTLQREVKGSVVQAVGDVAATVEALRKQYPKRRIMLAAAGPTPDGLEIERLELPRVALQSDREQRRAVQEVLAAAKVPVRGRQARSTAMGFSSAC